MEGGGESSKAAKGKVEVDPSSVGVSSAHRTTQILAVAARKVQTSTFCPPA